MRKLINIIKSFFTIKKPDDTMYLECKAILDRTSKMLDSYES
jgi:hypothetical protein